VKSCALGRPDSCSVGLDLKKFAAANYFYDPHTDGILAWPDLLTITNFPHYDHAVPLYFHPRPGLHEPGDGYAETRFRRAIDLARNRSHDGNNYRLVGCKTGFGSTVGHLTSESTDSERYFKIDRHESERKTQTLDEEILRGKAGSEPDEAKAVSARPPKKL
jgi:hypothetical protein